MSKDPKQFVSMAEKRRYDHAIAQKGVGEVPAQSAASTMELLEASVNWYKGYANDPVLELLVDKLPPSDEYRFDMARSGGLSSTTRNILRGV